MLHAFLAGILGIGMVAAYQMVTTKPRKTYTELKVELDELTKRMAADKLAGKPTDWNDVTHLERIAADFDDIGNHSEASAVRTAAESLKIAKFNTQVEL